MSGGIVRLVPPPGPAAVRVLVPAAPAVIRAVVPDAIAAEKGFGYVRYGEAASAPQHSLDAGVPTPFTLTPDSSGAADTLRGPFAGWEYWDGAILRTRAINDVFLVKIRMMVTASVAGGDFLMELVQAGAGNGILVDSDPKDLAKPAGVQESVTFRFELFTGQAFFNNGGRFIMTSSVGVTAKNEVMAIAPLTIG